MMWHNGFYKSNYTQLFHQKSSLAQMSKIYAKIIIL